MSALNHISGWWLLKGREVTVKFDMTKYQDKNHLYFFHEPRLNARWDGFNGYFDFQVKGVETLNNWNLKQLFFYFEIQWTDENGRRLVCFVIEPRLKDIMERIREIRE